MPNNNGWTEVTPPQGTPGPFSISPQSPMPTVDLYLSMGLSSLSSLLTTFSQANAIRARGEYESGIARTNATIARLQASQVIEAGNTAAARKNAETRAVVGQVRAQQGASGVDVNSGSSAVVRNAVQSVGSADELTIRNNAARQAWGYETEALEDSYKGQFAQLTAKSDADQTLLTGGLKSVAEPLGMYTRSKVYGSGGSTNHLPFNSEN